MEPRLAYVIFPLWLLLAACQSHNPAIGTSPSVTPFSPGTVITCTLESASNQSDIELDSVRLTDDYILALTENGLYRTTPNERRWSYLHCPDVLPVKGFFTGHTRSSDPILFITKEGLFSTSNNGSTWHLVSNAYPFENAFLLSDGTLYAITSITFSCLEPIRSAKDALDFLRGESWNHICRRNIVVMSSDFGQNWRNITGNIDEGISLYGISEDPDNPNLVILSGNNLGDYTLQAIDNNYNWQMYKTLDWRKNHPSSSKGLFTKDYWTQTPSAYYELRATLANYFDYSFGERVFLPGFDLLTNQAAYTFAPAGSKIITATIKLLPAIGSAQLIDLKDSADLWGIRILDNTDHSIDQLPKLIQLMNASSDRQRLVQRYRDRPDFYRTTISHAQTYTKSIELNNLFNLSAPGVYQVQLIYNNASIVDRDNGEWSGSFAGNVFTVTVKDR